MDNDDTRYSLADISNKAVALASQEHKDESRWIISNKNKKIALFFIFLLQEYTFCYFFEMKTRSRKIPHLKGFRRNYCFSELFVIHVASWDSESRRWNVTMPKKDDAVDLLVPSFFELFFKIYKFLGIPRSDCCFD